jgi:hypothetical protein
MTSQTKQFAKTLQIVIRAHAEEHGLAIERNDLLIAYDPLAGRIVVTFAIEALSDVSLPDIGIQQVRQAAE